MSQMSPSKSDNDLITRTLMNIQALTKESAKKMGILRHEYERMRSEVTVSVAATYSSPTARDSSFLSKHSIDSSTKSRSPKINAEQSDRLRAMFEVGGKF